VPPDLFPKKLGHTKGTTTALAQSKQASKHNEEQADVGDRQSNKGE
jgi:hypothetical protein